MAYLTFSEYEAINPISDLTDDDEFAFLAERASDILNDLTKNRINFFGFSNFSADTQTAIQKATAAEIDLLNSEGAQEAVNGNASAGINSVSIGRYSENKGDMPNGNYEMINGMPVAPMIRVYLRQTNLLYLGLRSYKIEDFNI